MNPSEAPRHVSATDSAASMPLHPADRHAGRHAAVDARTAVRLTCSQAYLPGMPPAAGLRPDPTPLGDQGRCGRAGDLLTARRDGKPDRGVGCKAEPRALHPTPRPGRDEPAPRGDHQQARRVEGSLNSSLIHRGSRRSTGCSATRINACRGRDRHTLDGCHQTWKACWEQSLTGSNPVSSASLNRPNAGHTRSWVARRSAFGCIPGCSWPVKRPGTPLPRPRSASRSSHRCGPRRHAGPPRPRADTGPRSPCSPIP